MKWFNFYGFIIMIVIMIPNIVFSLTNKDGFQNKYMNAKLEMLEQISRFSCFTLMIINIPFLTKGYWFSNGEVVYIFLNIILCTLYCLFWIVFWNKSSVTKSLLLSIIPSAMFVADGIILLNIPLIIFSVVFSICHITISYKNAIL